MANRCITGLTKYSAPLRISLHCSWELALKGEKSSEIQVPKGVDPHRYRLATLAFLGLGYGVFVILVDLGWFKPALDFLALLPGGGDELGHSLLFFGGGWILRWAMVGQTALFRHFSLAGVSLLLVLEEFTQLWLPGRSFSWFDLFLGLLGLILGFTLKSSTSSR